MAVLIDGLISAVFTAAGLWLKALYNNSDKRTKTTTKSNSYSIPDIPPRVFYPTIYSSYNLFHFYFIFLINKAKSENIF